MLVAYYATDLRKKILDTQRFTEAKIVREGLRYYYEKNDKYPEYLSDLVPDYLTLIPIDLKANNVFLYQTKDSGQDYQLCTQFEKIKSWCVGYVDILTDSFIKKYKKLSKEEELSLYQKAKRIFDEYSGNRTQLYEAENYLDQIYVSNPNSELAYTGFASFEYWNGYKSGGKSLDL